jgi:hypothetical protein
MFEKDQGHQFRIITHGKNWKRKAPEKSISIIVVKIKREETSKI